MVVSMRPLPLHLNSYFLSFYFIFLLCCSSPLPVRLLVINSFSFSFFNLIYLFLERGEGREKERERNINVWLPLACPLLGTWPATQACAPNGNRTSDPLVCRPVLSALSHTSQGWLSLLLSLRCDYGLIH